MGPYRGAKWEVFVDNGGDDGNRQVSVPRLVMQLANHI
jgi:hypothetical protein